MSTRRSGKRPAIVAALALGVVQVGMAASGGAQVTQLRFDDVPGRTKEFIAYYHSITLSAEQRALKERVLGSIPASCCWKSSMLTCCCPCNFAKSVWGLSHYAIAKLNYDADELSQAVLSWIRAVNPSGFTGDACYRNRCGNSFAANGCGGMREDRLVF